MQSKISYLQQQQQQQRRKQNQQKTLPVNFIVPKQSIVLDIFTLTM